MRSLFVDNELLDTEPLLLALVRHGGGLLAWDGVQLQAPHAHLRRIPLEHISCFLEPYLLDAADIRQAV